MPRSARALVSLALAALLVPLLPSVLAAPACDEHESEEPRFFVRQCDEVTREGNADRWYEWTIVYVAIPEVPGYVPYGYYLYLRLDRDAEDGCAADGSACHKANDWRLESSSRTPAGAPLDTLWLRLATDKPAAGGDCHARIEGRDVPAAKVPLPCYLTPGVLP